MLITFEGTFYVFLIDSNCALNAIQNGLFLRQTHEVKKQGMYFLTFSGF